MKSIIRLAPLILCSLALLTTIGSAVFIAQARSEFAERLTADRPSDAVRQARVESASQELGELRKVLESLRLDWAKSKPKSPPDDSEVAKLQALVARTEARLEAVEGQLLAALQDPTHAVEIATEPSLSAAELAATQGEIEKLLRRVHDPSRSLMDRVQDAEQLSALGAGIEQIDPGYHERLASWLPSLEDAELSTRLVRRLKSDRHEGIKDWLLARLVEGSSEELREEAAESLAPSAHEPRVAAALQRASGSDPSRRVREQAAESLRRAR